MPTSMKLEAVQCYSPPCHFPISTHPPLRQTHVCMNGDFRWMIPVSSLPQHQRTTLPRPTRLHTIRALRQVIPASPPIKLRRQPILARVDIMPSLDTNTLALETFCALKASCRSMLIFPRYADPLVAGRQDRHAYTRVTTFQTKLGVESSSPLRTLPIQNMQPPNWLQESRTILQLDSTPTLPSPPPLSPLTQDTAEIEDENTASDGNETDCDCEEAFSGPLVRVS